MTKTLLTVVEPTLRSPRSLPTDFQVAVQLPGDAAQHVAVAGLLGHVEAGEEPMPQGDEVGEQ